MSKDNLSPDLPPMSFRHFLPSINIDYPALRLSGPSPLDHQGTMRKSMSLENVSPSPPKIRLPPISKSDLEEKRQNRTLSRFAHSYQGLLYKSKLTSSMPDLKPQQGRMKYEKLCYSKSVQEEPMHNTPHTQSPPNDYVTHRKRLVHKHRPRELQAIDRKYETDIWNIVNTTHRTVQYYEHDGQIYISDNNQSWKDDCVCKICKKNKKEYFDSKRKLQERRQRKMKNAALTRERHNSPLKEANDE